MEIAPGHQGALLCINKLQKACPIDWSAWRVSKNFSLSEKGFWANHPNGCVPSTTWPFESMSAGRSGWWEKAAAANRPPAAPCCVSSNRMPDKFFSRAGISYDLVERPCNRLEKTCSWCSRIPMRLLNPRLSVRQIIEENLVVHKIGTRSEQLNRIEWVLKRVGIRPEYMDREPARIFRRSAATNRHRPRAGAPPETGSSRRSAGIGAGCVHSGPSDESVGGNSGRASVNYLLIAHDLAVVEHMSDDVAVMYLGRIIEVASDIDIYRNPRHPYTQLLLKSVPGLCRRQEKRQILTGEVPSPLNPPSGCHFHSRCPRRMDVCSRTNPRLVPVSRDHRVACHLWT